VLDIIQTFTGAKVNTEKLSRCCVMLPEGPRVTLHNFGA